MPKDTTPPATLRVTIGQYSDSGRKSENQDFHGAMIPQGHALELKGITLAVADGISSSSVSAVASETTVKSFLTDYYATPDAWTVKTAASRVIAATNAWLHGQNTSLNDINTGHVCTLSALVLKGREAHILHVGDSRIQRLTGVSLEPLTEDHRMTISNDHSYLARSIGADHHVEIDYRKASLAIGDVFILTTDGVHDFITARDVHSALAATDRSETGTTGTGQTSSGDTPHGKTAPPKGSLTGNLDHAARKIARAAFDAGSDDNLTVQIVRIDALPDPGSELSIDAARLPVPPLPKAGDVIDGFRILRPLHSTARSHVFLAADPDGTQVALKIPATEMAMDVDYLRRFVLEEWIARRLNSAHVLRAAAIPSPATALYVVTEYVEGITLRQWMIDTPKPDLETVRGLINQIAMGLRAFHRREMIHQDIRPENVMIDPDGTVKIIDLGSTAVAGVNEAAPGTLGILPGTYQYTAPEYLSGDDISWRSDQYALGVIAYEMLTGRLPYGANVARIRSYRDQMRLVYRPARDDDSPVPVWMDAALRRATHPDPLRRYDALSEFVADLKTPGSTYRATQHVPLVQRNPLRFWQGISAALAVLCIILAVQLAG